MAEAKFTRDIEEVEAINKSEYLNYAVDREIGKRVGAYWDRWKWWALLMGGAVSVLLGWKALSIRDLETGMSGKTREAEQAVQSVHELQGNMDKLRADSKTFTANLNDSADKAQKLADAVVQGNLAYVQLSQKIQTDFAAARQQMTEQTDGMLQVVTKRLQEIEDGAKQRSAAAVASIEESAGRASTNSLDMTRLVDQAQAEYKSLPGLPGEVQELHDAFEKLSKKFPELRSELNRQESDSLERIAAREKAALEALKRGDVSAAMQKAIDDAAEKAVKKHLKSDKNNSDANQSSGDASGATAERQ